MNNELTWKKFHPLTDQNAFICLADKMGTDTTIAERARTSYGNEGKSAHQLRLQLWSKRLGFDVMDYEVLNPGSDTLVITDDTGYRRIYEESPEDKIFWKEIAPDLDKAYKDDRNLIRTLMRNGHTSPFEMVEMVFLVQVPMDCWRQWVRHRTASINEYSTRYTEALDFFQVTQPTEWRLQATNNKQGSGGYLEEWPEDYIYEQHETANLRARPDGSEVFDVEHMKTTPGEVLESREKWLHEVARTVYQERLALGVAKEQARKDLPLSTYTRAYWKCDLHNIFNFLRLRMDSHAQLEIRQFANCMFEIVKQLCPVACEAFEDYVLHAKKFSRMEIEIIKGLLAVRNNEVWGCEDNAPKPNSMSTREWKEFLGKLS